MTRLRSLMMILGGLLFCSHALQAGHTGKALWIELRNSSGEKTTIAVTEKIARQLMETEGKNVHFSRKGNLITKEMVLDVLNGRKETVQVRDDEEGGEVKLYMDELNIPGKESGKGRLVLETHKAGKSNLRISLGDIEIEKGDQDEIGDKESFGWKRFVPFLTTPGGAVYINSEKDDSEVWIYVE